jgi:hypothetical protein
MSKPEISGIAPFFIVKNVPAAMTFYRDRLGCDDQSRRPPACIAITRALHTLDDGCARVAIVRTSAVRC